MILISSTAIAIASIALAAASAVSAADFPDKPIRLVIPFTTGGATDSLARAVADGLAQRLGQPVIADNRPGGTSSVGASFVAKSKPDGYTLLFSTATHAILGATEPNLPFDPANDFDFVGKVGQIGFVLLANTDVKVNDLPGLLAIAKAEPGKLQYGSAGTNSQVHLWTESVLHNAGGSALHVPYRGELPALVDLMGGRLHFLLCTWATCGSRVNDSGIKPLAVTTKRRYLSAPSIPTVAESGLPAAEIYWWSFLATAKNTPAPVMKRLSDALNEVLKDERFRQRLAAMGIEAAAEADGAATRALVQHETSSWRQAISKSVSSK